MAENHAIVRPVRWRAGADLVSAGLDDLARGRETVPALLVCMARTRLRSVGIDVPVVAIDHPSHRPYDLLAEDDALTAQGRFNALVRRLASFARAAEHARALTRRVFAHSRDELRRRSSAPARVYLTIGATAVLEGWRSSTIDVDLSLEPDDDLLQRALRELKERPDVNIELVSPGDFIPALPGGATEAELYGIFRRAQMRLRPVGQPCRPGRGLRERRSPDADVFSPGEVWALVHAAAKRAGRSDLPHRRVHGVRKGEIALLWRDGDFTNGAVRASSSVTCRGCRSAREHQRARRSDSRRSIALTSAT